MRSVFSKVIFIFLLMILALAGRKASASIYEVTNLSSSGVTICHVPLSAVTGTVYNSWTSGATTINPNAGANYSWWIYEPDLQIRSSYSVVQLLWPTDGQPASNYRNWSKWGNASQQYSISQSLFTTGQICTYGTGNGTTLFSHTTTAAVFTNGSQTSPKMITYVYNGSTGQHYVNDSAVASTLSGGAVTSSIFDVPKPFQIGGEYIYFNGYIPSTLVFNGLALSAQQVRNIYTGYKRLGVRF